MKRTFDNGELVRFKENALEKRAYNEKDSGTIINIGQKPMKVAYVNKFGYVFTEETAGLAIDSHSLEKV